MVYYALSFPFLDFFGRFFWTGFSNAIFLVGINDFRLLILNAVTLSLC